MIRAFSLTRTVLWPWDGFGKYIFDAATENKLQSLRPILPKYRSGQGEGANHAGQDLAARFVGSRNRRRRPFAPSQSESRRTFSSACSRSAEAPASLGGYRLLRHVCRGALPGLRRLPQRRRPLSLCLHSRHAYPSSGLGDSYSPGSGVLLVDRSGDGSPVVLSLFEPPDVLALLCGRCPHPSPIRPLAVSPR